MLDERSPEEPEEFDPEKRWGSPEFDLPNVPDAPTPTLGESDAAPRIKKTFWASVIFANLALFGLTVGPMVLFFREDLTLGGVLLAVGAFSAFRTWSTYVSFRDREEADDAGTDTEEAVETADEQAVGGTEEVARPTDGDGNEDGDESAEDHRD